VELESSTPAEAGGPTPIPLPHLDDGPHLSYAIQWFIFATLAVIGWVVVVRKSGRDHKQGAHYYHKRVVGVDKDAP
jgi:cytochrome oxidase assembly protein ShyY1